MLRRFVWIEECKYARRWYAATQSRTHIHTIAPVSFIVLAHFVYVCAYANSEWITFFLFRAVFVIIYYSPFISVIPSSHFVSVDFYFSFDLCSFVVLATGWRAGILALLSLSLSPCLSRSSFTIRYGLVQPHGVFRYVNKNVNDICNAKRLISHAHPLISIESKVDI